MSLKSLRAYGRLEWLWFLACGALAFVLTTWRLTDNGYANLYYAAAVKSMAANSHAWFFASLDPTGFVSIDKPPLGFWLQVLSVRIFGFTPFALLFPQALAGAIAPPLLGIIVRRVSTTRAAVVAAFALALTPIWIISARDNIVDVPLALTLILGAGALMKAVSVAQRTNMRLAGLWREAAWLTLAFALIGLAFNIKTLQAYLVVPAFVIAYLVFARRPLPQRLIVLLLALCVMVGLSLAWIVAVDLTPATQRPYVDSTKTNSEFDLTFGYNGLGRVFGNSAKAGESLEFSTPTNVQRIGEPGPLRLLQRELGSQVSWLAPFALLGLYIAWPFSRADLRPTDWRQTDVSEAYTAAPADPDAPTVALVARGAQERPVADQTRLRQAGFLLFGAWLVTGLVFFSVARHIDTYYLTVIAPALCALTGIGIAALWRDLASSSWRRLLVPIAALVTLGEQAYLMVASAPHWATWPVWTALALGALGGFTLLVVLAVSSTASLSALRQWLALPLLLICFLLPTLWTTSSLTPGNAGSHPIAGPQYAHAGSTRPIQVDPKLLTYLKGHGDTANYFIATRETGASEPFILTTDAPIMTLGGFSGYDPIFTPSTFRLAILAHEIRFVLLPAEYVPLKERALLYTQMFHGSRGSLPGPTYKRGDPLYHWIATYCRPIAPPQWSSDPGAHHHLGKYELYDCSVIR